ncbi:MAG: hypothetical protein R3C51_07300 [Parvularculaceae bacterium]
MSDRLKQIWSGFEGATTRRLTGRGIDNIEVPHRELNGRENDFLPENFTAPADAAFAALKHRLSAAEQRALKRQAKKRRRGETQGYDAPPAPLSSGSPQEGAPEAVRDLIRGLKATQMRVYRDDVDYAAWLAENPKAAPRARKKIFGIF